VRGGGSVVVALSFSHPITFSPTGHQTGIYLRWAAEYV
jgi:hypothetical protein